MDQPRDLVQTISSLKNVAVSEDVPVEIMKKTSQQVSELLTSDVAVNFLKQNPKEYHHLEVLLPIYVRVIFHPDRDVADRCFIHRELFLEIFQSKLPGIKKEAWYKDFEAKSLLNLICSLESRIAANDESWVPIWIFATNLVVNCSLQTPPLNKLLSMTEYAFKKGKENIAILDKAWVCWVALINAFERFPEILTPNRIMKLLIQPLRICSTVSKHRISTWVHLIKAMGPQKSSPGSVKSLVQPFCHAMYEPLERAMSRHFPDQCTEALIEILSLDHVVDTCLPDLVSIFGACVNSRPSGGLIELFASALIKAVNGMLDDGKSFKLWKALLEQYNNCTESQILSQASQVIFSDVNFHRWVESGTVGSKDISELMKSCEFRNKVLLRSVKALNFEDQDNTPTKKKSRKGSCEVVWSNYCEAFISWWSTQDPPRESEMTNNAAHAVKDGCDYLAVQFLLLQPIQHHMWNQAISKAWARLCEACHVQKMLHTFVKAILDAVDEPNFQVQQAIYVSDCLFKIDNSFCKLSTNLLETISSAIKSMEFQCLLDVLNLLEAAVLYPETASVICKICKIANEKSCDYDQLNTHKIRTKVGKITRKLENTSSGEKEKLTKALRTPFRTQSNFLQRLAKAEEKNRTKSSFLTSVFSSAEKTMNCIENGDGQLDDNEVNDSADNIVSPDDVKKPLEDSEIVPVIALPSVLKSTPVKENDVNEGIVAEKENVIIPTVTASPQPSSPRLKITNAREVKTIDPSSPSVQKKMKPMAGQKSTPKKVTPSKVSYFDDDANDCVMVPPKPKTTPLTEHQMEVMSKRRTDIPALYQDLSQDTQTSQPPAVIEEVTTGVSPHPIQQTQDIVPGTPSPEDRGAAFTPDRQKSSGKSSSSAKKLDFNGLQTPPSKVTPLSSSFQKMSPVLEQFNCDGEQTSMNGTGLVNSFGNEVPGLVDPNEEQNESKVLADKRDSQPVSREKSRKKRKSEPTKFSPKLTRSKKSLKSATPDAKMSITLPISELKSSLLQSPNPKVKSPSEHGTNDHDLARNLIQLKSQEPTDVSSQAVIDTVQTGNPPGHTQKEGEGGEEKVTPQEDKAKYGKSQEDEDQPCQRDDEILPSSQTTPKPIEPVSLGKTKKNRKRKADESSLEDSKKTAEEDGPSSKRSNSSKKKKPFKLGAGGNLENWLVKTDRVPTPIAETEVKIVKIEKESSDAVIAQSKCSMEIVPENSVVDLNNSEEIVPSTQESGKDNCVAQSALKSEAEEGMLIKEEVTAPRSELILHHNHSPPKPEESVLERLAHESPNDDIDLIISPSKRQRRAPSVFRGEGDTYLLKDEFHSTTSEEPDEESKSPIRAKNKTASPTSYRKKLQPARGRSAEMLRLATGTASLEENVGVVTPVRRRESIAPVKYGENWPKGHMEDWVARTPSSPCASPFRSVLKKTPGNEENVTPKRNHDSLASPLLSSAKKKRVVFLDPPVTRGLLYEVGSPSGSLHHADVPQGSPYPTWKGDDDRYRGDPKSDTSPSKRDAERLNLLDLKPIATVSKEESQEAASPPSHLSGKPKRDLEVPLGVSNEVRRLLDPPEPPTIVPCPEPDMGQFQEKYHLPNDFMTRLSDMDAHIRYLLIQCFECANMADTVDSWKFGDCRQVCQIPYSFLNSVRNSTGETLTGILSSAVFPAPTNNVPPVLLESSAQTDQLKYNSTQTNTPESKNAKSQTAIVKSKSIGTNTEATAMVSESTQADLTLPSVEDLTPLLKKVGIEEALQFYSDSMRILKSSLSREN